MLASNSMGRPFVFSAKTLREEANKDLLPTGPAIWRGLPRVAESLA
jgi:hypothetical protein